MIGFDSGAKGGAVFYGWNPMTRERLEPGFISANRDDVDRAAQLSAEAFTVLRSLSGQAKGRLLRTIAEALEANVTPIVERAQLETALPQMRLNSELARTANQLRLFASLVEEGSWVDARIETALPDRKPLPRPDIRSMLRPLGPVVVFGASNFPLAFSVAGGDTASALAAGNPVLVKAHPAHPGTSELVGAIIRDSVRAAGLPEGTLSLLFDGGTQVGAQLVAHPHVKAVGFTGSTAAGKTLMRIAASRPEPIPCYAEMGSVNPLILLSEALRLRGSSIAAGLLNSFTLGSGQFCTKPGLVFVPETPEAEGFVDALRDGVKAMPPQTMLTDRIAAGYDSAVRGRKSAGAPSLEAESSAPKTASSGKPVTIFRCNADSLIANPSLADEVFGPTTLLVTYRDTEQLAKAFQSIEGQLTATIHGTEADLAANRALITLLEARAGRLLFNGFPTGVEVGHAMVHGGPYPATSDGRSTSVGTRAILRFVRPVCYQDFPDSALPAELQNANPLGILRMVNGAITRDPLP